MAWKGVSFLGGLGLSLGLSLHLIESCTGISYWQFGTLPIGIFCQIWTQDSLRISYDHLMTTFEICQLMAPPGLFEYFWQNWVSLENQIFSMKEQQGFNKA